MPAQQDLYNAWFEFGGDRFGVIVRKFEYSWKLVTTGSSQSRQRYVVYPKRVERTPLSVSLIFRNLDEYLAFGRFMRKCHLGMTDYNNPYDLFFSSSEIKSSSRWIENGAERYGVKYSVAIKSISMSANIDTVAPTMNLTMEIIRDMLEPELDNEMGIADVEGGSVELNNAGEKLTGLVMPLDIGDSAGLSAADAKYRHR